MCRADDPFFVPSRPPEDKPGVVGQTDGTAESAPGIMFGVNRARRKKKKAYVIVERSLPENSRNFEVVPYHSDVIQ